ncbi:hypothetical protein VTI74DRAFT_528 [Chaetomium olivicolor]
MADQVSAAQDEREKSSPEVNTQLGEMATPGDSAACGKAQDDQSSFLMGYEAGEKDGYQKGYKDGFSAGCKHGLNVAIEQMERTVVALEKESKEVLEGAGRVGATVATKGKGMESQKEKAVTPDTMSNTFALSTCGQLLDLPSAVLRNVAATAHAGDLLDEMASSKAVSDGTFALYNVPSFDSRERGFGPESEEEDLIDLFNDAKSHISGAGSVKDSTELEAWVGMAIPSDNEGCSLIPAPVNEEEDLIDFTLEHAGNNPLKVFGATNESIASPSFSEAEIITSPTLVLPQPNWLGHGPSPMPIPNPSRPDTPTPAPRRTSITSTSRTAIGSIPTSDPAHITTYTAPLVPSLYGIPFPPYIRPVTPILSLPPTSVRTRPPYPVLSGRFNIYTPRPEGVQMVENPYHVLIGPLSAAAKHAWSHDNGKGYIRNKLNGGKGGNSGGVMFCEMVHDDEATGYVLAMFESVGKAMEAEEFFRGGYACGGSIMFAWTYMEEE